MREGLGNISREYGVPLSPGMLLGAAREAVLRGSRTKWNRESMKNRVVIGMHAHGELTFRVYCRGNREQICSMSCGMIRRM